MNELKYKEYTNKGGKLPFDEWNSISSIMSEQDIFELYDNQLLKKKDDTQVVQQKTSEEGEPKPTFPSSQDEPMITSVPISNDLQLNQAQQEALNQSMAQPNGNSNLESALPLADTTSSVDLGGIPQDSSSVSQDFNTFLEQGIQLPSNPNNNRINFTYDTNYENQFNNTTTATPQESVTENINTTSPSKPKKLVDKTNDTSNLTEIEIPQYEEKDLDGNILAKINSDVKRAFTDAIGNTILETDNGLFPIDIYLNSKDSKGNQKSPSAIDSYENINGIMNKPLISDAPINESLKTLKGIDYISAKNFGGKDIAGNPITKEQEINIYQDYQSRGLGTLEYDENGNPQFKINQNTVGELDKLYGLDELNKDISNRNKYANQQYIESVAIGAEIEKQSREDAIDKFGADMVDKYGQLPSELMLQKKYQEQYQNLISQGYTEQQAQQDVKYTIQQERNLLTQDNDFILRNIDSGITAFGKNDEEEKQAWRDIANQYPTEFKQFFKNYTEIYGDKPFENSYLKKRLSDGLRRGEIKDELINYIRTNQYYSESYLKNKENEAQMELRNASKSKDINGVNSAMSKLAEINNTRAFIRKDTNKINALENSIKTKFKEDYANKQANALTEASADRGEISGLTKLYGAKLANVPTNIMGNAFQTLTSALTGNSKWSQYVNQDIEFAKNIGRLNKEALNLRQDVVFYTDKQGNKYKYTLGNLYKLDKDGNEVYDAKIDNNDFLSNLKETGRDKEWSISSVTATATQVIAEMYLTNKLGVGLGNLASKPFSAYAIRTAKELGTESRWYNILKTTAKGIKATDNASPIGMAVYTFGNNVRRNNEMGYDGMESWFKGVFDSGMMAAANRFFPDSRFFKEGDEVQKTAYALLKSGDKKGAVQVMKNFFTDVSYYSKPIIKETSFENFQESILEPMFQGVSDVVSAGLKGDRNKWQQATKAENFYDLSPETILATTLSTGLISGVQLSRTEELPKFNGLNKLEQLILSSNTAGLVDALKFIKEDGSFTGFTAQMADTKLKEIATVQSYLNKLPKENNLSIQQTASAITNLQKLENLKKEQQSATSESVKNNLQEQINEVEAEIAKTFEESKNNTIVNEQPQQKTQPEQTQETIQGQTTETNVQPEQTTVAGEQGVSIDLNAKTGDTLYKPTEQSVSADVNQNTQQNTIIYQSPDTGENFTITRNIDGKINVTRELTGVSESLKEYNDKFINDVKAKFENIDNASLNSKTEQNVEKQDNPSLSLQENNKTTDSINNNGVNNKIELTLSNGEYKGDFLNDYTLISEGSESTVYRSKDGTHVIKISEPYSSKSDDLYKSRIENTLLREILGKSGLEVIGYYEYNGVKNPIYRQNYIEGETLSEQEVSDYLDTITGVIKIDGKHYYKYNGKLYVISDFSDNVIRDKNGNIVPIDLDLYEEKDSEINVKYDAELKALENNTQNETTQTPKITTNDTDETILPEEEQEKINLERLNAYIEAKKQREQEQQVQVSPSEEIGNVQQNEAFSGNEQVQNIEQPSETQNAPLVSESKSTNGKYTIRVEPNSNTGIADAKIFDNNNNEVKLTNKQKEKYVAEHFAKQSYPETVVENIDKLRSDEYSNAIVEATNNPIELAQILDTENKFLPAESLNAKENAIANVIGNKVSRSSFIQFDDANNITFSIARGYGLTNKGKTIDVIAQEAEVFIYGDWDSQNPRVTTEDVIDFMKTYNNGAETFFTQPNQVYRDAEAKFEKLTGVKATKNALDVLLGKKTATKIDFAKLQEEADILSAEEKYNLRNEYNEWFNSLSLEDKNLELQKTYPYEQRTEEDINQSQNKSVSNRQSESSENVANQERDGATTEEIVKLQVNQKQITDNVIATIDNITLPDGESGFKVTVTDTQGNLIEDKNGDSEFEFNTQEEVDKFISQKEKGYKLSKNRVVAEKPIQVSPSSQYEGAVTYTQFGEGQEGTIYYENGVAKIKDKAGKIYSANSPLVKNLKDAEGNSIQLQKSNERLTSITKQAFDALVKILQKAFPRFAKVTYDFEAFKKQAEKLGATFNDIQRMVMAFHGSPHSFDKFTTEKIGTGEGAQAFGWGLYFTDLESIARNYAKNLGKLQLKQQYKGEDVIPQSPVDAAAGILNNAKYNTIKLAKEQAKNLRDIAIIDFPDRVDFWNNVINILSKSKKSDFKKVESKVLYSVSLHKGKTPEQYTWLEWDKPFNQNKTFLIIQDEQNLSEESKFELSRIRLKESNEIGQKQALRQVINDYKALLKTKDGESYGYGNIMTPEIRSRFDITIKELQNILNYKGEFLNLKGKTGSSIYQELTKKLGSDKEASLFLLDLGIDGIKYPAESISRGTTSDTARGFNYVVFDENAVTIEDKIQFMQTPNGTIYGAKLPDGTIYLNPQFLNANTPIHEFSHLFEQLLPSRFKNGVELLKQTNLGKKLFEQLKQEGNYANLTDEQLWGEALNTHIGNFGENEVNNPKGKLKKLQDWIKDFFAKVGDVLGIKKLSPDTQLRMFTEGVVKDLLGGKPIVAENQVSPSEQVQYSFLTENDYDTNGNIKPEVLAEIQAEREAIKAEAQANGTFMKAPNGKATNLNEAQWIDVRTKRFKDWFGDWENDTENASKVVDENGEPLVVYHGTNQNFNEFSQEKLGINTGTVSSRAFFFTEDQEEATEYAFLAAKKLISKEDLINEKSEKILKQIEIAERKRNWDLAEKLYLELEENELGAINEGDTTGASVYPIFLNIRNSNNYDFKERVDLEKISELIDDKRFDGLQLFNVFDPVGDRPNSQSTKQWVAYNPNQIKSATANVGTYSASSNDIRFSINSKTPLSVKEQTEVINDLVANGEDSAFAKLQETNWYKGLSEEQKQNVTPTNIAETIVNAVNSNKRNLEQKVERRDAKIEKLKDKSKSELEKQKKYYVDKINDIKQKYKDALTELNIKNKTAVEKIRERLDLRRSAVNQIKQLLSDKEVGKNVTPSEVMSLVRMSELFFNARDLDKAFDKFIIRFEKVFDKAQYRNKSAEEKFNDKLSKVNPLKADEKAEYDQIKVQRRNAVKIWKEKWFANKGGLIEPFLNARDKSIGLANWEIRVARNTVTNLNKEAKKIGFVKDSDWETFNKALGGDLSAIQNLPITIKPFVNTMRAQIDGLSMQLIENNLVTKEQAITIEDNLGKYITRGYEIFEGQDSVEKISKKFYRQLFKKDNSIVARFDADKWANAVTVYQQNVLNEIEMENSDKYAELDTEEKKQSFARQEGERRLLEYIASLESDYKQKGSAIGADTSVLEQRKEVPTPIRRLLGEYTDPRTSFLLTISRVSNLAYQRKFLSQVKEIGMGTLFFEEGDVNIPTTHFVKIASDSNNRYSPLNGLYTTPEFKEIFLDIPENTQNDLIKLWIKATGLVKVGKTVLSPITQAVNFNANFGFLIHNGLILDVKQFGKAFQAFADDMTDGKLNNEIVKELVEENILGQNIAFNELEKDFGVNMEKELLRTLSQSKTVKTAKDVLSMPFRLYKASDDFFKAFAYYAEADRYADAYFGKKYKELVGEERDKIRKIASEVVKNTMPNYDRRYKAADVARKSTYNLVGNFLSFQAESIRTKINSIQYALSDIKNKQTRKAGIKRLAGIISYETIYMGVTTYLTKAMGMGMVGLLGFFDDDDEDEKNKKFNLMIPEWGRATEKYAVQEKDGTITWYAYGNSNPYGIWYKTANAYFNGSTNTKGGLVSVFDELLSPFLGTEMSFKWANNTFVSEENDYGVSLLTAKSKVDYTIDKLSPTIVKVIKDNTDSSKTNDFDIYNLIGIKKYNFDPTQQLGYKYNDYADLLNDLASQKYALEKKVENGKATVEEIKEKWEDLDNKQKEIADEFREVKNAFETFGAKPDIINEKSKKSFKYEYNGMYQWWDYINRTDEEDNK